MCIVVPGKVTGLADSEHLVRSTYLCHKSCGGDIAGVWSQRSPSGSLDEPRACIAVAAICWTIVFDSIVSPPARSMFSPIHYRDHLASHAKWQCELWKRAREWHNMLTRIVSPLPSDNSDLLKVTTAFPDILTNGSTSTVNS